MEKEDSKSRRVALTWMGLLYVACIAALHVDILSGPTFQKQLSMRPEKAVRVLASVAALVEGGITRTILFTAAYGALCLAYAWGLSRLRSSDVSPRVLYLWAGVFAVLLVPLPPHYGGNDLVSYAQQGRVLAAYHQNPYLHALEDFGDAWAIYPRDWRNVVPYGPVIAILSAAAAELGGSSLVLTLGPLKLLMASCYLLSGRMVVKILDCLDPPTGVAGTFFFWNPLVFLERVGQGHNDAVMMALMMSGLYLIVCKKHGGGSLVLLLSALAKFTTLVLLPLHAWLLVGRRVFSTLLAVALISFLILYSCYLMFYTNLRSLEGITGISRLAWYSPTWLGGIVLQSLTSLSVEAARRAVQAVLLAIFAVFLLWRMTKVDSEQRLIHECGAVLIFFLLVIANQVNPWYLALAVPLVALAMAPARRSLVFLLTAWPLARYFRPFFYHPPLWADLARALLFYGILLAILWWHLRGRSSRSALARSAGQMEVPPVEMREGKHRAS